MVNIENGYSFKISHHSSFSTAQWPPSLTERFWERSVRIRVNSVVKFTDFSINKFAHERPLAVRASLSINYSWVVAYLRDADFKNYDWHARLLLLLLLVFSAFR